MFDDRVGATERIIKLKQEIVERKNLAGASMTRVNGGLPGEVSEKKSNSSSHKI